MVIDIAEEFDETEEDKKKRLEEGKNKLEFDKLRRLILRKI